MRHGRYVILALIALFLIAGWFFLRETPNPIGGVIRIERITFHDQTADTAFVRIPYIADSEDFAFVNVAIDVDGDGTLNTSARCADCLLPPEGSEWLVQNEYTPVEGGSGSRHVMYIPNRSFDTSSDLVVTVVLSEMPLAQFTPQAQNSVFKEFIVESVGTQEMGRLFSVAPDGVTETGVIPTVFADHGEHDSEREPTEPEVVSDADTEFVSGDTGGYFTAEAQLQFDSYGKGSTLWSTYGTYGEIDTTDTEVEPPTMEVITEAELDTVTEPTETEQPVSPPEPEPQPAEPERANYQIKGMPDQTQRYNECAPTAVSNSIRWLAEQHGFEDRIPQNTEDLIDEIKGYMEWEGGTAPGMTLQGKRSFIQERDLPLEAHLIGEEFDQNIHHKIYKELKKGQAVEVSILFRVKKDGRWQNDGAHLVTVTGVNDYTSSGGNRWLTIHDPATDEEESEKTSESYRVIGDNLVGYWSGGNTKIRYAVAQSPIFTEDGSLISLGETSNLVVDSNGLALNGQSVTRGRTQWGFFDVDFEGVGDHYVGDTFSVKGNIRSTGESITVRWSEQSYEATMVGPWKVAGAFAASGNINPNSLANRPPQTQVNGDSYSINQNFTCTEPGPAYVEYTAELSWAKTGAGDVPDKIATEYGAELANADSITVRTPTFECVAKPGTETVEESQTAVETTPACGGIEEDPAGKEIPLLEFGTECYPKFQFSGGGNAHDACGSPHYHSAGGGPVTSLTGATLADPEPPACGYGKIGEVTERTLRLNADQMSPFMAEQIF